MEPAPFLETVCGVPIIVLGIPAEHTGIVLDPDAIAERLHHGPRFLQHLVRVDNADIDPGVVRRALPALAGGDGLEDAVDFIDDLVPARGQVRPDQARVAQVLERAPDFVVAGLGGVVVVEARDVVERWDCAPVVGRDAVVRVAD